MPTLVILRHSKAEAHRSDDHSRVLAERGRQDAADVREWLRAEGVVPDLAVVSTAARTRETWELADPGQTPVEYDERVYDASTAALREVLSELTVDCAVLVGHNPGVERLAWELEANDVTNRGMATSGVVVFEIDDWDLTGARMTASR